MAQTLMETPKPGTEAGPAPEPDLLTQESTPPALPLIDGKPLRFAAPQTAAPPTQARAAISAEPPAARSVRAQRDLGVDWFEIGTAVLILACAAICIYRLHWAMQP